MEHVIHDKCDSSDWYFDDGIYCRKSKSGKLLAKIRGVSLPDPERLWDSRIKAYGTKQAQELKPQEATYALWDHWKMRENV